MIPIEPFPFGVAVNEKTNTIYVTNSEADELYVIDGNSDSVVKVIPVSGFPIGVEVNEQTNTVYVAKTFEDSIVLINGKTNQIIGSPIPTGAGPFGIGINEKTNRVYVLNLFDGTITVLGDRNLKVAGINPNPPVPLRVPIENIGVLQLAIHDLYNVDRTTGIDSEDFKLNLSTLLNHGDANIANGGEFRNMENPMTFSVATKFGQKYLDLIDHGKTPEQARNLVIKQYLDAVKNAYETTFYEQFPKAEPFDTKDPTLTGDLAFRTLHDLIPGKIMVDGELTPILVPSLVGKTLSKKDLKQLSATLDGQYDPEFRDMVNPMNGEHVDLLERDSSFASQFGTKFTFEELQSTLTDGRYDPYDQVMRIIRAEFGFSQ
jgi:YVTN family beta-propeller protein